MKKIFNNEVRRQVEFSLKEKFGENVEVTVSIDEHDFLVISAMLPTRTKEYALNNYYKRFQENESLELLVKIITNDAYCLLRQ